LEEVMIVCATRGGEASRAVEDFSIQLAVEANDEELVFLYVADCDVLASTTDTRPHDIAHDLTRLGEFIVIIAQERAQAAGLTNAHWVVRLGLVREEMISYLKDSGANRLVLGRPVGKGADQVFSHLGLDQFAAQIEAETGVKVLLADPTTVGG
jgi:hypothetical protein